MPDTHRVDPKTFGLTAATRIEQSDKDTYAIVIQRKSRIIMKDGKTLLEKVEKIRSRYPAANVSLRTTAPVCSKTRAFLKENGVSVIDIPEAKP